jgi:hypothetical protein
MEVLKAQFNRIVQRIWHLPEVEPCPPVVPGKPVEVEIEPYLAAVDFYIFPSQKGVSLDIYRSDGSLVKPGQDSDTPSVKHLSTFDRVVVHEPKPGVWRYEVVGGAGKVEVLRNPIPLRMRLISPSRIHPQIKPIPLIGVGHLSEVLPIQV